jgi:hypothetical protein
MARRKRATKKKTRISPTDALDLLMTQMAAPAAAKRLQDELHHRNIRIWRDGKLVRPAEVGHLSIAAISDDANPDRWHACVDDDRWDPVPGEYEFDADEIWALLPRSKAEPPSAEPAASERVKPGPDPQHDWPDAVTLEVIRILRAGGKFPKAPAMLNLCRTKWDWEPDPRQMQKLLKHLRGD